MEVAMWEKSMKPASDDATSVGVDVRTHRARKLKTTATAEFTAAYDPNVNEDLFKMISEVETTINLYQVLWICSPRGTASRRLAPPFKGWLKSFEPNNLNAGEEPEMTVVIVPSEQP